MSPHNVIPMPTAIHERQQHDPIEWAVRDIHEAGADFMIAILDTTDDNELIRLHRRLELSIACLSAISSAALERAEVFARKLDYPASWKPFVKGDES